MREISPRRKSLHWPLPLWYWPLVSRLLPKNKVIRVAENKQWDHGELGCPELTWDGCPCSWAPISQVPQPTCWLFKVRRGPCLGIDPMCSNAVWLRLPLWESLSPWGVRFILWSLERKKFKLPFTCLFCCYSIPERGRCARRIIPHVVAPFLALVKCGLVFNSTFTAECILTKR